MSIEIQTDVALAPHSTLGVGGSASHFVTVRSEAELLEAVVYAQKQSLPLCVLGGGSNVLVADEGIEALVIHMAIQGITEHASNNRVLLSAKAGEVLDDVIAYAVEHGLWGIENLSHIPGTIGAAPVQNVGAYGVEVQDVIASVTVFNTQTLTFEVLDNKACGFAYRDSIFKSPLGKKYIVCEVTFSLSKIAQPLISYRDLALLFGSTEPTLLEIREAVIAIRDKKFPDWHTTGTAGSFFKNPIVTTEKFLELQNNFPELPGFPVDEAQVKISLGWILDKSLNLKGYTNGLVSLYSNQALVLIAEKGARAFDVEKFAEDIAQKVKNKIEISIEWEVTKIK